MPLVDEKPQYPKVPEQPKIVVTKPPAYKGINVDNKVIDYSNLLTHIEGSSWTVTYFSQVLTKDTAVAGQIIGRNPTNQQYTKIIDFEIKVNTPITYQQDETTKSIKGSGGGNVYPIVIPNVGDMFIADLGDGNSGIFRITISERKSLYTNTVHGIEYVLVDTSANEESFSEKLNDLDIKTVNKLVYNKDFLQFGQNPLIQMEESKVLKELTFYFHNLIDRYFQLYASNEYKTLLVPGQMYPVYDHFLTKAILSFFNTYENQEIRNIKILNVQDDVVMKATNFWDMFKRKDINMFKYCFRKVGLVTTLSFTVNPMLEGIRWSGIAFTIYPKDPQVNVDHHYYQLMKPIYDDALEDEESQIKDLSDLISDNSFDGLTLPDCPIIHNVLKDDYYVFSEAFYIKDRTNMSLLEMITLDYLEGKALNNKAILALASKVHSWNRIEQFYYTPIILMIIKTIVNVS